MSKNALFFSFIVYFYLLGRVKFRKNSTFRDVFTPIGKYLRFFEKYITLIQFKSE